MGVRASWAGAGRGTGTWLLSRIVGLQTAAYLLYSGEVTSAARAGVEVRPTGELGAYWYETDGLYSITIYSSFTDLTLEQVAALLGRIPNPLIPGRPTFGRHGASNARQWWRVPPRRRGALGSRRRRRRGRLAPLAYVEKPAPMSVHPSGWGASMPRGNCELRGRYALFAGTMW